MGDIHNTNEQNTEATLGLEVLEALVIRHAVNPVVTPELQQRYAGQVVAFSLSDNKPQWGEEGAASTREELSKKMAPLKSGVDYYAYPIE